MSTNHQVFLFLVDDNGIQVLKEANGIAGPPLQHNTTVVVPGDSIEWLLGSNSHIESISRIYSEVNELFSNVPRGSQNDWAANINSNAPLSPLSPPDSAYSYIIEIYPSLSNDKMVFFDPKIRVISPHSPSPVA